MNHPLRLLGRLAPVAALFLAGCMAYGHGGPHGHPGAAGHGPPKVPPGHRPPPGECRIWYPDRPPGHQPPPGPCRELRYHVPSNAYLIRG